MKYLLDVNALISLGFTEHDFNVRVSSWADSLVSQGESEFATTPITELGFVRVLSQAPAYGTSVAAARDLLEQLKKSVILSSLSFPMITIFLNFRPGSKPLDTPQTAISPNWQKRTEPSLPLWTKEFPVPFSYPANNTFPLFSNNLELGTPTHQSPLCTLKCFG